jgi:ABC-type amino acid transport substrate-binding protein
MPSCDKGRSVIPEKWGGDGMKWMISRVCIGGVLFILALATLVHAEPLRVGYFRFPPHAMFENGKDIGSAIDYFKRVNATMKLEDVRFILLPNARLLKYVETGEIDIGLVFAKNAERAARFKYPVEPFGAMVMAVALKKNHPLQTIKSVDDLLPITIGYLKEAYLPEMLRDERLRFRLLTGKNWTLQNLLKVKNGRIDAALSDYYSLVYEATKNGLLQDLKILKLDGTEVGLYSVMSEACAEKHLGSYEAALEKVNSSKTYNQAFEEFIKKYVK